MLYANCQNWSKLSLQSILSYMISDGLDSDQNAECLYICITGCA